MDYNYIANQLILMFSAGRPTTEGIDVREVEALVRESHANIARQEFFENYKADNQSSINGNWLVTYLLPIQPPGSASYDSSTGYHLAYLPENYLPLPKNRGVVRVAVADPTYKGRKQLAFISLENYENIRGGSTIKFAGEYFYSLEAKTVFILPACNNQIKIRNILVTQAVANDSTINEGHVMLIISQVMPLMVKRYASRADMVTDANPNQQ